MDNREKQVRFVHEALVVMGVLALLCFVCRLWPILLLVILGVLIAAVRMVFLAAKKVETVEPMPAPQPQPARFFVPFPPEPPAQGRHLLPKAISLKPPFL